MPRNSKEWILFPGAGYDDATAGQEKEDDAVFPGGYYKYVWDINPKDGPTSDDPECLTYSYSSQVDTVRDVNSGLIGALLICKSSQCVVGCGAASVSPTDSFRTSLGNVAINILLELIVDSRKEHPAAHNSLWFVQTLVIFL